MTGFALKPVRNNMLLPIQPGFAALNKFDETFTTIAYLVGDRNSTKAPLETEIPVIVVLGLTMDVSIDIFGNTTPLDYMLNSKSQSRLIQ